VIPTIAEQRILPGELSDPLGENIHSPLPRLVHRYENRVLVVVTGKCALYCRHCFRRRLTGDDYAEISEKQAENIALWLSEHREVKELLLSGGDPLTLSDGRLLKLIDRFRSVRVDIVLRLATRIPVVEPRRVSASLARKLGKRRPLWVVIQVNHPRELAPETLKAIELFQRRGMPVINQTVLLRGVNDNADVLVELSNALVRAGVKPYYLFQGDLAEGTGHFRLPLEEGMKLSDELRGRVSGLGMPVYALDLPGGGGKVPLCGDYILGRSPEGWRLRTPDGREGVYEERE
jgi:lysine 2,3-aminomutase